MAVDITRYAIERLREREKKETEPGPVITLSREFGCPSKIIAEELTQTLKGESKKKNHQKWHWVTKEILDEAAATLGMTSKEIKYVFEYKERTFFDEILISQSKRYYYSDKRIRKTIGEVIRALGWEGYVIIIGRAGVVLTHEIKKSLHIRLMAPREWRIAKVAKNHDISLDEAATYLDEMDTKRKKFTEYYLKRKMDLTIFDLVINCSTNTVKESVRTIYALAKSKELI